MLQTRHLKIYLCSFLVIWLVGCESTGSIRGVSSSGSNVIFDYKQDIFAKDGELTVQTGDGEVFRGKFVQQSTSQSGSTWSIGESSNDDSLLLGDSTSTSSKTQALLIGNKGNSMKCQFQFSDPAFGIDGGGIGSCTVSDGREINLVF
ncbi:hypothetical protein [Pelagibaculum spongiae]|uniref:Lipoprotein n=1 Tax=Pelagibaculum spongiae TaxID=2080658 RepID=A0A2V1GSV3_9GAMM|nr:hypothetical protein [Pelagibaculum spongiae]PVZ68372.1 hypothetical protein DC094_13915 [Pelagibaculum spongiae]